MNLDGGTAIVTGAAGGIGLGMARACLDRRMRVVLADLDGERLTTTATALREAGAAVTDMACDVRDRAQIEALRDAALSSYGSLDLACNNAGIGLTRRIEDSTDADWQLLFDVNVWGVIHGLRTFLPVMIEQGRGHLNATASLSGLTGDPDLAIYNGTKFAVVGMMEGLALELHRDHPAITCSVLCPGPVATDLMNTSDDQLEVAGAESIDANPNAEDIRAYLAAGVDPDDIGRFAIDGIDAGKFWLISQPEHTWPILEPRLEDMRAGRLHIAADWTQPQ